MCTNFRRLGELAAQTDATHSPLMELGATAYLVVRANKQASAGRFLASGLGYAAKKLQAKALVGGLSRAAGHHNVPVDRRQFLRESVFHLLSAKEMLNKPVADTAENIVRGANRAIMPAGRSFVESVATNPVTATLAATDKRLPTWARFLAGGGLASAGYGIYDALSNK